MLRNAGCGFVVSEGETYLPLDGGCLFIRHSSIQKDRPSLVFLHGLGESGLSFSEAFDRPELTRFNRIAPDLLGFGRSSAVLDGDYSFPAQAARLWRALDSLGVEAVTLVGHSMGGDLATLMASWDGGERIKALVNIEGNLTPKDLFISGKATEAADQGRFAEWFTKDLAQESVFEDWGQRWPSCRRYYASLLFCRPAAFLAGARELVRWNGRVAGSLATEMGAMFCSLSLPKVFCWGTRSLAEESQQFLPTAGICHKSFTETSHWIMVDCPEEFYSFLDDFCAAEAGTTGR